MKKEPIIYGTAVSSQGIWSISSGTPKNPWKNGRIAEFRTKAEMEAHLKKLIDDNATRRNPAGGIYDGELINLYHLARVPLSGQRASRYDKMLWASKEYHKKYPEISATAAYKMLDRLLANSPFRNPAGGIRIVHNRLLGGWYIVRGPHQTPLGGRFASKAEAQRHLDSGRPDPRYVRAPYQNPRLLKAHARGVGRRPVKGKRRARPVAVHKRIAVQALIDVKNKTWMTLHLFPNTPAGQADAKKYAASAGPKFVYSLRALLI